MPFYETYGSRGTPWLRAFRPYTTTFCLNPNIVEEHRYFLQNDMQKIPKKTAAFLIPFPSGELNKRAIPEMFWF